MEKEVRRRRIGIFVCALLGFILGATIYDLSFNSQGDTGRVLFAILFGIVLNALFDIYQYKKYPRLKEKEKQLEKDERIKIIKGKAAYTSHIVTLSFLILSWFVTIVQANKELNMYLTIMLVIITSSMILGQYYWNKKI